MLSRFTRSNLIQSINDSSNMKSVHNENELQAILTEKSAEVCLLIDSPFRILRVSFSNRNDVEATNEARSLKSFTFNYDYLDVCWRSRSTCNRLKIKERKLSSKERKAFVSFRDSLQNHCKRKWRLVFASFVIPLRKIVNLLIVLICYQMLLVRQAPLFR